ncbi:MAG: hypothetical protein A3I07_03810 [Candidatus Doudnabacteria bacterium RIFCSPLOWO2_02_FULL_42_9]|uniref:Transposase IS200-like domain-containing protein n=1 Tax=Candidatus Doudnabacteria bacterium RIFCSPHIGHO2_01_FULL_41_86 TaxID=1817821 RepID=A0A1F5N8L0_9BACT|nr:MAG: hypothetical protein A2717_00500 [Candidatus Doudnabacteria bacterium RIFCSPHIGHO2_01_FULL_41_86]OGE75152.1 MAG: hypothetical protein A3K07_01550 [Candidatus Doudnabacteria bacterium RIFCSPHIGHO2_01_43_10]OGE86423.1 MAG: hypothetical protein A3E28_00375 [Candidatus Doudnabacteria bacterium RIFCSPHIGHO2_12_FULL_42_22]OGE87422.1 MAG: hypothetical protein A3C49_04360 [Candidatus Doudnabacteria bacterium RIFCSPHIGHO2_02_FULL_42_25]OGE92720.1 MAG: hypothetical protein A2895_03855 [Candidatus
MQYRDYKLFSAGNYYHIFNRGVNKQLIFFDDQDYTQFLKRLRIILGKLVLPPSKSRIQPFAPGTFTILAYCLMPNHFHFLIKQNTLINIDKLILKLCTSYVCYINKKYSRIGNLFQDRFKAKLVDTSEYASYLSAYIHNNPSNVKTYEYSSFQEILGISPESICDRSILLSWFENSTTHYEDFVMSHQNRNEEIKKTFDFEGF